MLERETRNTVSREMFFKFFCHFHCRSQLCSSESLWHTAALSRQGRPFSQTASLSSLQAAPSAVAPSKLHRYLTCPRKPGCVTVLPKPGDPGSFPPGPLTDLQQPGCTRLSTLVSGSAFSPHPRPMELLHLRLLLLSGVNRSVFPSRHHCLSLGFLPNFPTFAFSLVLLKTPAAREVFVRKMSYIYTSYFKLWSHNLSRCYRKAFNRISTRFL